MEQVVRLEPQEALPTLGVVSLVLATIAKLEDDQKRHPQTKHRRVKCQCLGQVLPPEMFGNLT